MDWSYVTGFFDADGYITFTAQKKGGLKTIVFGFTNTKKIILDQIRDFIFQETKQRGFICKKKPVEQNHEIGYDLKYCHLNKALIVLPHLDSIHPKKEHRINLTLQKLKPLTPRNGRYSDETLNKRQQFEYDFYHPKVS